MATGIVRSTTEAAAYVPEIWSLEVIEEYYKNFLFGGLLDRSFEELQKAGFGDTINVPQVTAVANFGTITQGNDVPEYAQVSEGTTTINVTTYEGLRIGWPSVTQIQAMPSLRQNYTREMGLEAAKAIDTSCAVLVTSIGQTVGGLGTDLTDDEILRGEQYIMDANAPPGDWFLVVGPAQLQGFRKIDKYANSLYKAAAATISADRVLGYIGPLYNCSVYQTTNVVASGGGHDNVMFQKRWAALVIQSEPKVEMWRNVTKALDEVIVWALWGVKEMRPTSGVHMKGL